MRLLVVGCVLIAAVAAKVKGRQVEPRQLYTLSEDHVQALVSAEPAPWEDVTSGHLGKLLIPRVGELAPVSAELTTSWK